VDSIPVHRASSSFHQWEYESTAILPDWNQVETLEQAFPVHGTITPLEFQIDLALLGWSTDGRIMGARRQMATNANPT